MVILGYLGGERGGLGKGAYFRHRFWETTAKWHSFECTRENEATKERVERRKAIMESIKTKGDRSRLGLSPGKGRGDGSEGEGDSFNELKHNTDKTNLGSTPR